MDTTLYAARVVTENPQALYLWKFDKATQRGIRGMKRARITADEPRAMMRATREAIEENIKRAAEMTGYTFEVVEFEVVERHSAFTYGVQGTVMRAAAAIDGAHHRNVGDWALVVRPVVGA